MLCDASDGSSVEELILRLGRGVVMSTWLILLLLVPFSISLVIAAELVKPSSVMELWVVKVTNSDELEHAV